MSKHAVLILSHSDISHIYDYAELFPQYNFYIHQDLKFPLHESKVKSSINNVFILPSEISVSVTWAGFSMVEASNALFNYALQNQENTFFHLISGSDLILQPLEKLSFDEDKIYMDCIESPRHRYRVRFDTPHADTPYQRTILGKSFTFGFKIIDKVLPTKERCLFGSQWFSISRKHLEIIMSSIDNEINTFFKKKLCPDEHYYQYLVHKNNLANNLSSEGNRRYIIFDKSYNNGNNPLSLNLSQVESIDKKRYWFTRKVEPQVINLYLDKSMDYD